MSRPSRSKKAKGSTGAPSLLTEEIIEAAAKYLPTLLYADTFAALLGIRRQTVNDWIRKGEREQRRIDNGEQANEGAALYVRFANTVKKAIAEGCLLDLTTIQAASAKNWCAAAWRMERRFPEQWSQHTDQIKALEKQMKELLARFPANAQPEPVCDEFEGSDGGCVDEWQDDQDQPAPQPEGATHANPA